MPRVLVVLAIALFTHPAFANRRRSVTPSFPPCTVITGTAAVTFSRDAGRTLAPSAETLEGIGYTYGVAALDERGVLLAWHRDDLLISRDHGCSWRLLQAISDADFPPRLTAAKGGRAYVTRDGGRDWHRSEGFGTGWVNAFNGEVSSVDGDVVWFMALSESLGRQIFRSTDGGATFTPMVAEAPGVKLVNGPRSHVSRPGDRGRRPLSYHGPGVHAGSRRD